MLHSSSALTQPPFITGVTLVVDGGLWLASSRMAEAWAEGVEQSRPLPVEH